MGGQRSIEICYSKIINPSSKDCYGTSNQPTDHNLSAFCLLRYGGGSSIAMISAGADDHNGYTANCQYVLKSAFHINY
jgi:hypothetical protein